MSRTIAQPLDQWTTIVPPGEPTKPEGPSLMMADQLTGPFMTIEQVEALATALLEWASYARKRRDA